MKYVIVEIIIEVLQITEEWNEENVERKWLSNRETTPFQKRIYVALNEKRNYDSGYRSRAGLEANNYLLFTKHDHCIHKSIVSKSMKVPPF
jgi:hypothetical protein